MRKPCACRPKAVNGCVVPSFIVCSVETNFHVPTMRSLMSDSIATLIVLAQSCGSETARCAQIEVLRGKRFQKILRVKELTGRSNPCPLEATFKNAFGCLHNYRCGDSIDVTSASHRTTLFASFAGDHIYQKDLCRASALIHRLRRGR